MSVHDTVVTVFTDVAKEHNRRLGALEDDAPLLGLGLDSLCMAVIVVRLESATGTDPFSSDDEISIPTTFGEFVALYDHAG